MRRILIMVTVCLSVLLIASTGRAQQISGDYVETRSADIYTGFCVANAEINLVGDQAVLGWRVNKGSWNGVSLDGLGIVAAVKANATLGDPYSNPYPAKAVLIVDEKASREQRDALISFAKEMGGALFNHVVRVEVAPIKMDVQHNRGHYSSVKLSAGTIAGIETRSLNEHDHLCGNETAYYPPLAKTIHAMPAVAVLDMYEGKDLGVTWTISGKRSAFVGGFAVTSNPDVPQAMVHQ
jgi:hypothetical protein